MEKSELASREVREANFIIKGKAKHSSDEYPDGKFNYDKVEYINNQEPVIITCPIEGHGDFKQAPRSHINSSIGCPACREAKRASEKGNSSKTKKVEVETEKVTAEVNDKTERPSIAKKVKVKKTKKNTEPKVVVSKENVAEHATTCNCDTTKEAVKEKKKKRNLFFRILGKIFNF